jgi:hypothetical protein
MARCHEAYSSVRSSQGSARLRASLVAEYFKRFPKDRCQTEIESWRELQSQNIEFAMYRLREPIEG